MSVPNQTPYIIYNANGLTTVFPFEFYIINSGDIQVTINGDPVTTGYTIAGVGNVSGGDVTFLTPPANGATVMLERVVPTFRLTDYQDNGDLLADTVNKDFDRIWMAIQRSSIYLGLALRRPLFGGPFNAEGYRIAKGADPIDKQDFATKNYIDSVALNRVLRVPDSYVDPLPPLGQLEGKIIGVVNGRPTGLPPSSGSATDVMVQLLKQDGLKYIGACQSINHLRGVNGDFNGQQIFLTSVIEGKNTGGGIFQWDASSSKTDEGGCIIQPNSVEAGRWIRQNVVEKTPEMYGALGDGVTDDTDAITAMFYSGQINKPDLDKFYGCFRLSRKYLISREIDTYWAIRVDARGAHFIVNSSITAFTPTCIANGEWQGGYFDYSGVPNSELNENAVALWPMKKVSSATAGYLTVMHTLITGIKTQGCHTAIKITPETGYTWQTHLELCELGVRAGVAKEKAHAINIEATGATNGGSTTLSMSKISTQDFTHSPRGVGRAGYRIWNISGVRMYDCSFDDETVGGSDIVDIFANFVEITGFHTENIVNTTAATNDGPFRIIGDIVVLDNFIMLNTDVWEPSCWISVYRGGVGSKVNIGQWYQKKKGNQHREWVLDLNKDQYSDVNLLGNVKPDQVFGMRTRGSMLSASASNYNVYHIEKSIKSGTAFITLPDTRSAYEISFRGDCVSDTGIAFYGAVKVVRSHNQGPYSVKYDVVNTENTFPSSTYPVSITAVGNQLVFTVPTGLAFDVQSKIDKKLTISELY